VTTTDVMMTSLTAQLSAKEEEEGEKNLAVKISSPHHSTLLPHHAHHLSSPLPCHRRRPIVCSVLMHTHTHSSSVYFRLIDADIVPSFASIPREKEKG